MMQLLGYLASLLIGISLGLFGGGGAILTLPVLVYLFGVDPVLATSYSMFIVGLTSLVGAVNSYRSRMVRLKPLILLGTASLMTVMAVRRFVITLMPQRINLTSGLRLTLSSIEMICFSILASAVGFAMILPAKSPNVFPQEGNKPTHSPWSQIYHGVGIGGLTGFLGAGGGFIIVPTLVLILGMAIQEAAGTSLAIISLNSLLGFLFDVHHAAIVWRVLLKITLFALIGLFVGQSLSVHTKTNNLKQGFGWFILLTGFGIFLKEFLYINR